MGRKERKLLNIIGSNLDCIGGAIDTAIRKSEKLEREKLEFERDRLDFERVSKDRVNISLREYEKLKRDNADLKRKCWEKDELLERIKIGQFIDKIIPQSIQVQTMDDPARLMTRVNIQFDCNNWETRHDVEPFKAFRKF